MPCHSQPVDTTSAFQKVLEQCSLGERYREVPTFCRQVYDRYNHVVVSKAATLAPYMHTSGLLKSTGSETKVSESLYDSVSRPPVRVARQTLNVIPNRPFYNLLANVSNKPVYTPKCTIVTNIADILAHTSATKAALLETGPATVGAVHYKSSIGVDTQIIRHKYVKAWDDKMKKTRTRLKDQCSTVGLVCRVLQPDPEHV